MKMKEFGLPGGGARVPGAPLPRSATAIQFADVEIPHSTMFLVASGVCLVFWLAQLPVEATRDIIWFCNAIIFITARKRSLGQGNISEACVKNSVHRGGSTMAGTTTPPPGQVHPHPTGRYNFAVKITKN